jgi:hypothetical protein
MMCAAEWACQSQIGLCAKITISDPMWWLRSLRIFPCICDGCGKNVASSDLPAEMHAYLYRGSGVEQLQPVSAILTGVPILPRHSIFPSLPLKEPWALFEAVAAPILNKPISLSITHHGRFPSLVIFATLPYAKRVSP